MTRVAIVTGAARGIGAALVHRLAEDGWQVMAVDACADNAAVPYPLATQAQLEALVAAHPDAVRTRVADVRDADAVGAAVRSTVDQFGGVDAAVACAAVIAGGQAVWETTEAAWDALFDVDVRGVWNLARAAVPALLERPLPRQGRFLAVASAAAHRGLYHLAAYGAAKHAVDGLVRGLAADLRGTGVTASVVSPGSTRTDMLTATAALYGVEDVEHFAAAQQLERLLEPDEVAASIAWLCSPDSSAITGTAVRVDGGFTV